MQDQSPSHSDRDFRTPSPNHHPFSNCSSPPFPFWNSYERRTPILLQGDLGTVGRKLDFDDLSPPSDKRIEIDSRMLISEDDAEVVIEVFDTPRMAQQEFTPYRELLSPIKKPIGATSSLENADIASLEKTLSGLPNVSDSTLTFSPLRILNQVQKEKSTSPVPRISLDSVINQKQKELEPGVERIVIEPMASSLVAPIPPPLPPPPPAPGAGLSANLPPAKPSSPFIALQWKPLDLNSEKPQIFCKMLEDTSLINSLEVLKGKWVVDTLLEHFQRKSSVNPAASMRESVIRQTLETERAMQSKVVESILSIPRFLQMQSGLKKLGVKPQELADCLSNHSESLDVLFPCGELSKLDRLIYIQRILPTNQEYTAVKKKTEELNLPPNEWGQMEQLVLFLGPIARRTQLIEALISGEQIKDKIEVLKANLQLFQKGCAAVLENKEIIRLLGVLLQLGSLIQQRNPGPVHLSSLCSMFIQKSRSAPGKRALGDIALLCLPGMKEILTKEDEALLKRLSCPLFENMKEWMLEPRKELARDLKRLEAELEFVEGPLQEHLEEKTYCLEDTLPSLVEECVRTEQALRELEAYFGLQGEEQSNFVFVKIYQLHTAVVARSALISKEAGPKTPMIKKEQMKPVGVVARGREKFEKRSEKRSMFQRREKRGARVAQLLGKCGGRS